MRPTTIAVDLAKSVFEVAVSNQPGRVKEEHRLSRTAFARFMGEHRPATVVMEACSSGHHWARRLRDLGHQVVLLPPHEVRPYVPRNKTDRTDAKAILEAYRNEAIHPVPVKSLDQHALAGLHRLRSAWFATRTARINTVRGLLRELGVIIPVGAKHVVPRLRELLADPQSPVPQALHAVLAEAAFEIRDLEHRIDRTEKQLRALAQQIPTVAHLESIPGVGLLTATALVAFVGEIRRFPTGRHFASYLGLTPRERSSGTVRRLGRISKRGDAYLRMLLTHGARAVLRSAHVCKEPDTLRVWALRTEQRRGHNKAAIALANKLARIACTVWKEDRMFVTRPQHA
jgi:transposase